MIYGLYLSATGVLTNSYRQDVIANNLANSETIGFKRDLAVLQQRPTGAQELNRPGETDPMLEAIGGGLLASRTQVDTTQGEFESTGSNLDVGLQGVGYLAVAGENGQIHLTRNGEFLIDRTGRLSLSNDVGQSVLDDKQTPIYVTGPSPVNIAADGTITQDGKSIGRLGLFNVSDPAILRKDGGTLMSFPAGTQLSTASPTLRSGFVERSNVDPSTELVDLLQTQRELEANANMIHYQDETLDKLVNDVGKVS